MSRTSFFQPKHRLVGIVALAVLAGSFMFATLHYFGVGHAPKHTTGRVTWWSAPSKPGGSIGLGTGMGFPLDLSVDQDNATFSNDEHSVVLAWRFLRNSGNSDAYEFKFRHNQGHERSRTVYFDGTPVVVSQDESSGTSVSIEPNDADDQSGELQ